MVSWQSLIGIRGDGEPSPSRLHCKAGGLCHGDYPLYACKFAYIVIPSGQAKTAFDLVKHDTNTLVFEAPGHDFPTRVIYTRSGNNRMTGRMEGKIDGKDRAIDFPMQRAACK